MKNQMFSTKKEANEFAAHCVAMFWLKSAADILARGEKPCPMSKLDDMGVTYGRMLARAEMDRDIYNRFRHWMNSGTVYDYAKQEARERLQRGEFPTVAAHFTAKAEPKSAPMVQAPPPTPVTAHDKLANAYHEINEAISRTDGGMKVDGPLWANLQACRREIREAMQMIRDQKS